MSQTPHRDAKSPSRMNALPVDPEELVQYRTPDEEPDDTARVRVGRLYGSMLLHREHDLYVAKPGDGRSLQDLIRERLRAERFDPDDADEWAFRDWPAWLQWNNNTPGQPYNDRQDAWLCDQVVQAALSYRDTGMPIDEAFGWTIRSVSANYAVSLRKGWNPESFGTLAHLCIQQSAPTYAGLNTDHGPDVVDQWVNSSIVSWRALRYVRAGMRVNEALALETRRLNGEDIDPIVDTLIALSDNA